MKRELIQYTDKAIRQHSVEIADINDSVRQLVADMIETAAAWEKTHTGEEAVAMAAIQIGDPRRLTIIRDLKRDNNEYLVLINPTITPVGMIKIDDHEGCLSVDGVYSILPRYKEVTCDFTDLNGNPQKLRARGLFARILQHEVAHMDGSLFIDYINEDSKVFCNSETGQLDPVELPFIKDLIKKREANK